MHVLVIELLIPLLLYHHLLLLLLLLMLNALGHRRRSACPALVGVLVGVGGVGDGRGEKVELRLGIFRIRPGLVEGLSDDTRQWKR